MYDGPEQVKKFTEMTKKANVPEDLVILRDRWYDQYNDFGVKLTNRAGTVKQVNKKKLVNIQLAFIQPINFLLTGMETYISVHKIGKEKYQWAI